MGYLYALVSLLTWGLLPIYWKKLNFVSAEQIVIHRIIWSAFFLIICLFVNKQLKNIKEFLSYKKILLLLITSSLVLINWLLFIWAVNNNYALDASLGYFINPLVSILLSCYFLSEKLSRLQKISTCLAVIGMLVPIVILQILPIIALTLAITFSAYAVLKKKYELPVMESLFMETLFAIPFALGFLIFNQRLSAEVLTLNRSEFLWLASTGVATSIPLLAYVAAAQKLKMVHLSFLFYINPTIQFITAIFYFNEPLNIAQLVGFIFVWFSLIIFSYDLYKKQFR